jgi:acyl-CoA reductase-like NAD-dependent aldehyde dehydrogenase
MAASPSPFPRICISSLEGRARSVRFQKSQLRRLHEELVQSRNEIQELMIKEEHHTEKEAAFEYVLLLSELSNHYAALNSKSQLQLARRIELRENNISRTRSVDIVYIVPSKHTPVYSIISPIGAAISAGSCIIVEVKRTPLSLTGPKS